jgi:hypothetical protein
VSSIFPRRLRRWGLTRVAAGTLGLASLLVFGAFGFAAISIQPTISSLVAAVAALSITGVAILYAWREPGR